MKKLPLMALLAMAALLPLGAQAQVLCALGPTSPYDPMADMPPSAGAQGDLKKVKALLCAKTCGKVLLFANATTATASTVTDGQGASKIVYNPGFVGSVQKLYGPIATLGILAHELGHHLDATGNRPGWIKDGWDAELRADAWAGCAMAKAALRPSGLQAALVALSTYPSPHHPAWSARRPVVTDGYTGCGGRDLPPISRDNPEQAEAGSAPPGCTGDKDCRKGRACVSSRCTVPPARTRCGKDTDCPDPQECDPTGHCAGAGPATPARTVQDEPEPEPPAKTAGPTLAALQGQPQASASPPGAATVPTRDRGACQQSCDDARNQCIQTATGDANRCLATIQSEPGYRTCSCPNYPYGDFNCYRTCAASYERSKTCAPTNPVKDCRTEGERCRTQCQ